MPNKDNRHFYWCRITENDIDPYVDLTLASLKQATTLAKCHFTEAEITSIDARYMAFAIPIEEA